MWNLKLPLADDRRWNTGSLTSEEGARVVLGRSMPGFLASDVRSSDGVMLLVGVDFFATLCT